MTVGWAFFVLAVVIVIVGSVVMGLARVKQRQAYEELRADHDKLKKEVDAEFE